MEERFSTIKFFVGGVQVDPAAAQATWVARAQTQATAWKRRDPRGFARRCEQIEAHVMRRTARVHVPARLDERRPAGRRLRSRTRARAPARLDADVERWLGGAA